MKEIRSMSQLQQNLILVQFYHKSLINKAVSVVGTALELLEVLL